MAQETLRLAPVKELRIPMPWGHIAAKAWGNPDAKIPVLAFHGWMDNAGSFDHLVPFLSNKIYFVSVDFPGHGLSSHLPPGIPYHFGDFLISMRRIANYLKWSRFSIVGHSMGAALSVYFASAFPQLVDRLVMLDIIKAQSYDEGTDAEGWGRSIDHFINMEDKIKPEAVPSYSYQDALDRQRMATDNTLSEASAKSLMVRGTQKIDTDKWTFTRDVRLRSPTMYKFTHEHSLHILSSIKCHNLLIKAKDAPVYGGPQDVIDKTLEIYRKNCASFKYVMVDGNHFVHLNNPETIADLVNPFLLEGEPPLKSGL